MPYALPLYLAEPQREEIAEIIGRRPRSNIVFVDGLAVEVYLIPAQAKGQPTLDRIVPLLPEIADPETHWIIDAMLDGGQKIPILTGRGRPVRMMGGTALRTEDAPRATEVAGIYARDLARITRLTGCGIRFHLGDDPSTPPYPVEEGVIDLLAGASPPGELETHLVTHACGLRIEEEMGKVECRQPVPGRGAILTDEQGTPVAQIVDNTVYLLIPVITFYHGKSSLELFRKLLVIIWNGLLARKKGKLKPYKKTRGKKGFVEELSVQVNAMATHLGERLSDVDRGLAILLEGVRRKYAERADILRVQEALTKGRCAELIARLPADYQRIGTHACIDDVYMCHEGLHVDTQLIVMTDEVTGKRHPIGRFTIRIGVEGVISIWPIETRHPERVPHPHLSMRGTACYGNGTQAIIAAAAEMRYADAIELILRWLTEGYMPDSALNKLSEWPTEGGASE